MASQRPLLVTLIAILYLVVGFLTVVGGAVILLAGGSTGDAETLALTSLAGGPSIIVGLISVIIGYGFLKGWKLWWYLGIIFAVIGIILSILSIPAGIITLIIEIIILWYLFRPNVKSFFLD